MNSLETLDPNKHVILFVPVNKYVKSSNEVHYLAITGMKSQYGGFIDFDGHVIRLMYGEPVGWLELPQRE